MRPSPQDFKSHNKKGPRTEWCGVSFCAVGTKFEREALLRIYSMQWLMTKSFMLIQFGSL